MRVSAILGFIALTFQLHGVEVRHSPAEYPVQGAVGDMKVGAEYMVTTFSAEGQSFSIDDHLIVELGIFPQKEANVDARRFALRINGKRILMTQTPGMVAASVKYPDWTSKPTLQAEAGPIIVGRTQPVGRFPGDRRAERRPAPDPSQTNPTKPEVDYEDLIKRAALSEGKMNRPLAGLLYFPYDGKLKSIRTVELLVDETPLKLR